MRSPNWTRDEVILALDLYLKSGRRVLGAERPEVMELSRVLNQLEIHPSESRPPDFRSPGSVERKLANLRSLDPSTESVGLTAVSRIDRDVWDEFLNDESALYVAVSRILSTYRA